MESTDKISIFVLQHMDGQLPSCFDNRNIYRPIQCGAALRPHIDNVLHDDAGDNISELNVRYNEMTAIYWIAKHYDELGNPEYVGFDHYRRFLNWLPEWLAPGNVVVRKWFSWRPLRNQYACCHNIADLDRFSKRFEEFFGGRYADYKTYWKTHWFYICNVFVMHRDDFRRYSEFILKCIAILQELEKDSLLVEDGAYRNRIPGFILETMTSFWIWHEQRAHRINVIPSTITHYNITNASNGSRPVDRKGFLWFLRQAY